MLFVWTLVLSNFTKITTVSLQLISSLPLIHSSRNHQRKLYYMSESACNVLIYAFRAFKAQRKGHPLLSQPSINKERTSECNHLFYGFHRHD